MTTLADYLQREHHRIEGNIDRLERGLTTYDDPNDPCADGQRAMLDIQRDHLALLEEMQQNIERPAEVLSLCALELAQAVIEHDESRLHEHSHNGRHCDSWWQTLGRLDYLSKLTHDVIHLRQQQPAKEPA